MAIQRIPGELLQTNLTRSGVDLAFETNLLYLDVTNMRVGIGTSSPGAYKLDVSGDPSSSAFFSALTSFTIACACSAMFFSFVVGVIVATRGCE